MGKLFITITTKKKTNFPNCIKFPLMTYERDEQTNRKINK